MHPRILLFALTLVYCLCPGAASAESKPGEVLLLADFSMEPKSEDAKQLVDAGPLKLTGTFDGESVKYAEGHTGKGLHFEGIGAKAIVDHPGWIERVDRQFTITAWVKLDSLPDNGSWTAIVSKSPHGGDIAFALGIEKDGKLSWRRDTGVGAQGLSAPAKLKVGEWQHVAASFEVGGQLILWINGKPVAKQPVELPLIHSGQPLAFGCSGKTSLHGTLDDVRFYATTLSAEQIAADMRGELKATRAATARDFSEDLITVRLSLGRFDQPAAFCRYDGRRLHSAIRCAGPDAVDWPVLKLNGEKVLFQSAPVELVQVKWSPGQDYFRTPKDNTITPINHWFRKNHWRWGRNFVYTTDRTARTSGGDYELWTFPVKIGGSGDADIQSVKVRLAGETIYERVEKLRSLTLLLPANLNGAPYELTVNNRAPVKFDVGLEPVAIGKPEDVPIKVNVTVPGIGPKITVASLDHSETFPNQKEWDADIAALSAGTTFTAPACDLGNGFGRYLGLIVPRSPVEVFTTAMQGGMSAGHKFLGAGHTAGFKGTPDEYAAHLQAVGYDFAIDGANSQSMEAAGNSDQWIVAMARRGLKAGINPSIPGNLGILENANLTFQSCYLPEWGASAFREAQLVTERFARYPNFLGMLIGADNAGYVPYWDWAPTIPDRPWGRAYLQFQQGHEAKTPVGPGLKPAKSYERKGTQLEFVDYIHRYDETFKRYGYFARAVEEVKPDAKLTTASFGSSPGVFGHGGWPAGTIPGKQMHENLPVQTAYDWNELSSSKPLHNLALVDRLQSYYPTKPTWALIDEFLLFSGREARQRVYALALTRGVQAVGTTFLAHETAVQNRIRPSGEIIAEQKELYSWIHQYAGAYLNAKPIASIGVLYVHEQAISRPSVGDKEVLQGSHEGKTTEALFLCHMAGWPARIITPEELKRGLPSEMKAVLLVGLNRFDNTWSWYDGMEGDLTNFTKHGGRLIQDDESVVPDGLTAVKTGMQVAAYITQNTMDQSPLLLSRNHDNVAKLCAAMGGIQKPIAISSDETIWAVPHQAGDVQYVTAINWGSVDGQSASRVVKPQVGKFIWNTDRPIYDVQTGRKLTRGEAQTVDLTQNGFRLFALPPTEVSAPKLTFASGTDGFWTATAEVGACGVPVQLVISSGSETATLSGASGTAVKLPVGPADNGNYSVTVTELLSRKTGKADFTATPKTMPVADTLKGPLERFAARKEIPLIVALTPEQETDASTVAQAKRVADFYAGKGRKVETRRIAPGDVVKSLQPLAAIQRFPQWYTVEADLVLFGTPHNNILLFDEARGGLLSVEDGPEIIYSPFVGDCQVLNILAHDSVSLGRSVQQIVVQ